MEKEPNLAENIDALAEERSFGEDVKIVRIDSPEKVDAVIQAELGMDFRVKIEAEEGLASVFEGVDFDPKQFRTQSYLLEKNGEAVAVITFAIAPKKFIEKQKYFRKVDGGIEVCDFKMLTGGSPDFLIIPGWAKVAKPYLSKFAWPGFKLFNDVLKTLQEESPENTWIEITAQGTNTNREETGWWAEEARVGDFFPEDQLPFKLEQLGVPADSAVSTSKMADLLKIPQIPNVGDSSSLGPVYAKVVK